MEQHIVESNLLNLLSRNLRRKRVLVELGCQAHTAQRHKLNWPTHAFHCYSWREDTFFVFFTKTKINENVLQQAQIFMATRMQCLSKCNKPSRSWRHLILGLLTFLVDNGAHSRSAGLFSFQHKLHSLLQTVCFHSLSVCTVLQRKTIESVNQRTFQCKHSSKACEWPSTGLPIRGQIAAEVRGGGGNLRGLISLSGGQQGGAISSPF